MMVMTPICSLSYICRRECSTKYQLELGLGVNRSIKTHQAEALRVLRVLINFRPTKLAWIVWLLGFRSFKTIKPLHSQWHLTREPPFPLVRLIRLAKLISFDTIHNAPHFPLIRSCRVSTAQHGEMAVECADAYYYYGKSLLELAKYVQQRLERCLERRLGILVDR